MSSRIYNALIEQRIKDFINMFLNTTEQVFFDEGNNISFHNGEYGGYRELITKKLIEIISPQYISIGSGFVISSENYHSTQCDLILFDKEYTPTIETDDYKKFFPIETVIAIGEVKSTLDATTFKEAIIRLVKVKEEKYKMKTKLVIRSEKKRTPDTNPFDNLFTFLICKKFSFNLNTVISHLDEVYSENSILPIFRNNFILSIEQGVVYYLKESKIRWIHPVNINSQELLPCKFYPDESMINVKCFIKAISDCVMLSKASHADPVDYMDIRNIGIKG